MDKLLDTLLRARVHMLLIVAGLLLLFAGLLDLGQLPSPVVKTSPGVGELAAFGTGTVLLVTGLVIYLRHPRPAHSGDQHASGGDTSEVLNLQGKTIVFTGTLNLERDVLARQAGRLGATTTGQVTGNTDYLIAGTKPGASKIKAAARHKVSIVSAEQWYATVNKLSR